MGGFVLVSCLTRWHFLHDDGADKWILFQWNDLLKGLMLASNSACLDIDSNPENL